MADYLSIGSQKKFKKMLTFDQHLLISCQVIKFNRFKSAQKRFLVITNKGILNLKKLKLKRRIDLIQIAGVTRSQSGQQFVIHVPNEYDYRYSSANKKELIRALQIAHQQTIGRPLIIWQRLQSNLQKFSTTKADRKKGRSRIPHLSQSINYTVSLPQQRKQRTQLKKPKTQLIFSAPENFKLTNIEDFKKLKVISRGTFSKVILVQLKYEQKLYAMKMIKKDALLEFYQEEYLNQEKKIRSYDNHPFLARLQYAFASDQKIYFIMGYLPGGELFFHLKQHRKFDQERSRFYAAQIALGLGSLHQRKIICKDLKPEKILLDGDGNACIQNFGLARMIGFSNQYGLTPEYTAPQIIINSSYSFAADWWSFGIFLYEMIVGIPPFYSQNIKVLYQQILNEPLRFPQKNSLSIQVTDLIQKLLEKHPSNRLGFQGVQQIKTHPFFQSLDWQALLNKKLVPPFKPKNSTQQNIEEFLLSEEIGNEGVFSNRIAIKFSDQGFEQIQQMFEFKIKHEFYQRKAQSQKLIRKHPGKVPIVLQSARGAREIGKTKFLCSQDFQVQRFVVGLRKKMRLEKDLALFLFVNGNQLVQGETLVGEVYQRKKDEDGFLYFLYAEQLVLG